MSEKVNRSIGIPGGEISGYVVTVTYITIDHALSRATAGRAPPPVRPAEFDPLFGYFSTLFSLIFDGATQRDLLFYHKVLMWFDKI